MRASDVRLTLNTSALQDYKKHLIKHEQAVFYPYLDNTQVNSKGVALYLLMFAIVP